MVSDSADEPAPSDPTFRSVRLGSMPKPAFGPMGPLPKLGKAPMISSRGPSGAKQSPTAVPPTANADEHAPKFVWVVTVVPPVPVLYPLERTVLKLDGASVVDICGRISDFMRQKSIKCANEPASDACIGCLTPTLLKFVVQLWKSDEHEGPEDDAQAQTIIIEVQRRRGCAIEMKGIRNCLYHAIQNGGDGSAALKPSCAPRPLPSGFASSLANSAPASSASSSLEAHEQDPCGMSLQRCSELLSSDKRDLQCLGFEGLCKATDPTRVSPADAERASRVVLFGDSDDFVIREAVENVLSSPVLPVESELRAAPTDAARVFALRALTNALESYIRKRDHAELDLSSDFWCALIDSFVRFLAAASSLPAEASLSAKALNLLRTVDPSALAIASGDDLHSLLLTAYKYGKASNSSLEEESGKLIGRVSITC